MDGNIEHEELEGIFDNMTEQEKDHFKATITQLVRCYAKDGPSAVLIIGWTDEPVAGVTSINATPMTAAHLLTSANNFFNYMAMNDAPPRKDFN
jgi:hypothetical protein